MNAIGHVVAGFALEFYILLDRSSPPGEVPEDVVFRLGMVDGPFSHGRRFDRGCFLSRLQA